MIETHCHLDYLKDISIQEVTDQCTQLGIEKLITISVSPDNLDTVVDLCEQHSMIWGTQGIHPHDAKDFSTSVSDKIKENIEKQKIVAIGEIGLDYHYNNSPREKQISAFETQLQIACDKDFPVVIHTREADDDTKSILKNFSNQLKKKGVIHSFTSSIELAEFCLDQGFYLGFNGICTFNKAENVRDIVKATPIHSLLLETDAPFLTPVPYRGKENAPIYLPFIAEKISQIKDIEIDEVLKSCYQNSLRLFF